MSTVSAIGGQSFGTFRKRTKTMPKGRVCAEGDCKTVLSIYNMTDHCPEHPTNLVRDHVRVRGVRFDS